MKSVRGCTNQECDSYKESVQYNKDFDYCPKCGSKLMAVCRSRGCHTFIDNPDGIYCARCLAKRKDRLDQVLKGAELIGGLLATAATAVVAGANKSSK